jgi:hypothetical protein
MIPVNVLEWEMHARGTRLDFVARRFANAYEVVIRKDDHVVITEALHDMSAVLRKSLELRQQLQRLGYSGRPPAPREPQFAGGVSWGPAQSLDSSVAQALLPVRRESCTPCWWSTTNLRSVN